MSLKNTSHTYGTLARALHWLTAALVLGLLCLGFYMAGLAFSDGTFQLYTLHKSFGMLVLILSVIRLAWRCRTSPVLALSSHTNLERCLAKSVHGLLYVSLLGMPFSGWLMTSAGNFPNHFFFLFLVSPIFPKNEAWFIIFQTFHEGFALLLLGLIGLHIAGALKHHLIEKDNTLRRMGGNILLGFGGLAGLAFAGTLWIATPERTPDPAPVSHAVPLPHTPAHDTAIQAPEPTDSAIQKWIIDPSASMIGFHFTQDGQKITGSFKDWRADIAFDPESLDQSTVRVTIQSGSIQTGSTERDQEALKKDWFAAEDFPEIVFQSVRFAQLEKTNYHVTGTLTVRGKAVPVSFPFTLVIVQEEAGVLTAHMQAVLTLNRKDLGIGQGMWESTQTIANPVEITLDVLANSTP